MRSTQKSAWQKWKEKAEKLNQEIYTLVLANLDSRTPWYAKVFTGMVVAYALSPIDLIPDFIPVLGYLDDLILVPLGVAFAIRLIPDEVLFDCRSRAQREFRNGKPVSRVAAVVIIFIWVILAAFAIRWVISILM